MYKCHNLEQGWANYNPQPYAACLLFFVCLVFVCVCGLWAKSDFWMVETNKNQKEDSILWDVKLYENSNFSTSKQSFMFIYLHAFCFHTAKEECMTDSVYTEKPKKFTI